MNFASLHDLRAYHETPKFRDSQINTINALLDAFLELPFGRIWEVHDAVLREAAQYPSPDDKQAWLRWYRTHADDLRLIQGLSTLFHCDFVHGMTWLAICYRSLVRQSKIDFDDFQRLFVSNGLLMQEGSAVILSHHAADLCESSVGWQQQYREVLEKELRRRPKLRQYLRREKGSGGEVDGLVEEVDADIEMRPFPFGGVAIQYAGFPRVHINAVERRLRSLNKDHLMAPEEVSERVTSATDPAAEVELSILHEHLEKRFRPEAFRALVMCSEGYSYQEIADVLSMKEEGVRSLIYRTRVTARSEFLF